MSMCMCVLEMGGGGGGMGGGGREKAREGGVVLIKTSLPWMHYPLTPGWFSLLGGCMGGGSGGKCNS